MEITIRHAIPEDAAALHRLYSEPPLYRDTLQLPYAPVARWEERLKTPPRIPATWSRCWTAPSPGN